jgi:hypothetical protein
VPSLIAMVLTAVAPLTSVLGMPATAPNGGGLIAVVTLIGVLIAALAAVRCLSGPPSPRTGPLPTAVRGPGTGPDRGAPRQTDPDAAGHARPRAPGARLPRTA